MVTKTAKLLLLVMMLSLMLTFAVSAQMAPMVEVSDQVLVDDTVTISKVVSEGPGFIVIHKDNGEGSFGAVIGHRAVSPGENYNVKVEVDAHEATSTLYAMLHVDTGEMGVYEFGTVDGADGPVVMDGAPVSPPFSVAVIHAHDQFIENNTFVADSVVVDAPGWLVVHAGDAESFGAVLGQTFVEPGMAVDVEVALEGDITPVVWPMLHVDTGVAGEYEFGTVEGADGPVVIGGAVATTPIWTVPHMRVHDQVVVHGDGMDMEMMMAPSVTAHSVLSEGLGWLVIHSDNDGAPGPVAGYAAVAAGINTDVVVELDPEMVTPVLWPMLHVDTGVEGEYEFGTVEGADGPVRVNDKVVVFPIHAAPFIDYAGVHAEEDMDMTIAVHAAMVDAPGWLVIHSDNGGAPGPVLGYAPLTPGLNEHIHITLDADEMPTTVFPMLHYDTGEAGVYEFGTVEGADGPVKVGGSVVVGPAEIGMDGGM